MDIWMDTTLGYSLGKFFTREVGRERGGGTDEHL